MAVGPASSMLCAFIQCTYSFVRLFNVLVLYCAVELQTSQHDALQGSRQADALCRVQISELLSGSCRCII